MRRRSSDISLLEIATLTQVSLLFIGTTWAFGGAADWVRPYIAWGGSASAAITLAAALAPEHDRVERRRWLMLLPGLLFNLVTLAAVFTPGMRLIPIVGGGTGYLPLDIPNWLPSAALPGRIWPSLQLFDGLYLSAFNLLILVRRRRALRTLIMILVANTLALAAFGTVQKLVHATGPYFGLIPSPQPFFFSTFIYDNHWGAFIVLMCGAALSLAWHHADRDEGRGFFHTPGFAALVAVFFIFATVPLSGARICTTLCVILLGEAGARWLLRLRRRDEAAAARRGALAVVVAVFCCAAVWFLAKDVVTARLTKTHVQLSEMWTHHTIGSRGDLYRDTWRMASDRPWFGWGMGSFPWVFQIYNRQGPDPRDMLPRVYRNAHSDWLQSLSVHGWIGMGLLALCAVIPFLVVSRRHWSPTATQLLCGCGLVLLYAAIEFPFDNVAVVLTWWILFFTALRYGELGRQPRPEVSPPAP